MMREDDDGPLKKPATHVLGEGLDTLSVEELRERIALLRQEIVRLDAAILAKEASRGAADAVFKR